MTKVLGIDPGYDRLGLALIEKNNGKEIVRFSASLGGGKSKEAFPNRLFSLGQELEKIILKYKPELVAIEKLFFTNNQKTAMHVAEVRGVITYLATKNKIALVEYGPLEIKQTITGFGRADKKQLMSLLPKLAKIDCQPKTDDEFDAIAIGLTALARRGH